MHRHGVGVVDSMGVMESVTEAMRRAASWNAVTESDTCGASRKSRHGMRYEKNQPSQNAALSECHGKVVLDSVMESNTCATPWKDVTEIKSRRGMRHGNREACSNIERSYAKRY